MFSLLLARKKKAATEEEIKASIVNFSKLLYERALVFAVFSQFPSSASMWYSRSNIQCSKSELIAALKSEYLHMKDDEQAQALWWILRHHAIRIVPDTQAEPVNLLNCDRVRAEISQLEKELDDDFMAYEVIKSLGAAHRVRGGCTAS